MEFPCYTRKPWEISLLFYRIIRVKNRDPKHRNCMPSKARDKSLESTLSLWRDSGGQRKIPGLGKLARWHVCVRVCASFVVYRACVKLVDTKWTASGRATNAINGTKEAFYACNRGAGWKFAVSSKTRGVRNSNARTFGMPTSRHVPVYTQASFNYCVTRAILPLVVQPGRTMTRFERA